MRIFNFSGKAISLYIGLMVLVIAGASISVAMTQPIEITMLNKGYEIKSGGYSGTMTPGFSLTVGTETKVILTNEDSVAHDFISPMFNKMDVILEGEATKVISQGASGYRVAPGKKVVLKFTPPVSEEFKGGWGVFWCDIHGKQNMRGEVIVVDSRTGEGAF